MYFVQIYENERDIAIQDFLYEKTGNIIVISFICLFASILYQINIY